MKDRIQQVRRSAGLNQTEFGKRIGVAQTTIAGYENGSRSLSDAAILSICREFCINETWLRTGAGNMKAENSRAAEMAESVKRLFSEKPESFQTALVTTLLRFNPNGPQWEILERIYDSIAAETEKGPDASE